MNRITELNSWRLKLAKGQKAFAIGDYDSAELILAECFQLAPTETEVNTALGRVKWKLEKTVDAEMLLTWSAKSGDKTVLLDLAHISFELRKYENSIEWLDELVDFQGHSREEQLARARALTKLDDLSRARTICEKLLANESDPKFVADCHLVMSRVLNHEGIALCRAGKHHESIFVFRRAQWMAPAWSCPHVNMGAVFATIGKKQTAKKCYDKALKIDASNATAHYNIGLWYLDRRLINQARTAFKLAVDCDPDNADAWVQLGNCLRKEDPAKARKCWETALSIQPTHPEAKRLIARA